jgi:pimeloyl-ACP methyl ester carboxylesterase
MIKSIIGAFRLLLIVVVLHFSLGLAEASEQASRLPPVSEAVVPPTPDYSKETSWLAKPSDPEQFAVDIVWLYPTVLAGESEWLMDIANRKLIDAAELTVKVDARAFSIQANLYSPLYRQMNFEGFFLHDRKDRDTLISYGVEDVRRALEYYIEHYNRGRPFILAGHSQGSYLLTELMLKYWGKTGYEDQLIAGYVVGWSITEDDLKENPNIKICSHAKQIGCFITYNTVAPGKQKFSPVIFPGAVVVNPLTWTTKTTFAPAALNRGSLMVNKNEDGGFTGSFQLLPGFASAQIADGGLQVVAKNPEMLVAEPKYFHKGVYHVFDYLLFSQNITMNASQRIQTFLSARN